MLVLPVDTSAPQLPRYSVEALAGYLAERRAVRLAQLRVFVGVRRCSLMVAQWQNG